MSAAGLRRISVTPMQGREAPPLLLVSLREIEPSAELIYFGEGDWRLGSVRKTDARTAAGEQILAFESRRSPANPRNVLLGTLLKEGFAQIAQYRCEGDPALGLVRDGDGNVCTIVEDLRQRDANFREDQGRAVFTERMEHTDGTVREREAAARRHDYLINDGRDHYRREIKHRTTFGYGGQTGGGGSLILPFGA